MMRKKDEEYTQAAIAFEQPYLQPNWQYVAGADEVGRGPLAGPVVVVCAVMNRERVVPGIRDSKKLSEKKRNALFPLIQEQAISVGIGRVEPAEIDRINILNATRAAFAQAIDGLDVQPDFLFLDAISGLHISTPHAILVKGDDKAYTIGCASILAKVIRDNYMIEMDKVYPEYGFMRNKGYGTAEHVAALKKYGPCPIHRRSFIGRILGHE